MALRIWRDSESTRLTSRRSVPERQSPQGGSLNVFNRLRCNRRPFDHHGGNLA